MTDQLSTTTVLIQAATNAKLNASVAMLMAQLVEAVRAEPGLEHLQEHFADLIEELAVQDLMTEQRFRESEKWASIGRLASGIAHEITTPIQYVGDNLRVLSDVFRDLNTMMQKYHRLVDLVRWGQSTREALGEIEMAESELDILFLLEDAPKAIGDGLEGIERVSDIVRTMKDFSDVNQGKMSAVDINRVVQDTLTVARNEYKYVANVETQYGQLPTVEGYAREIGQAFLNLLVNAAHAIGETGKFGTISITTRHDGDYVEVGIADTGSGISEDLRDKVFEPSVTTKEVGKGTGQGLSIARHIVVEKHEGTLTFDTEVGKGTRFVVRLPTAARAEMALRDGGEEGR